MVPYKNTKGWADTYGLPVVGSVDIDFVHADDIVKIVKEMEDAEGIVIRFEDGNMLKIKSDWYIDLHRIKSSISDTRRVVGCILDNSVDDVYPILSVPDANELRSFVLRFWDNFEETAVMIAAETLRQRENSTRKDFALSDRFADQPLLKSMVFTCWDAEWLLSKAREVLKARLKDRTSSTKRFEGVKYLYGDIKWSGGMFS